MSDFLAAMIESSKRRAAAGRAERPLARPEQPGLRGRLVEALSAERVALPGTPLHEAPLGVIAEIKRRSPSKGDLAPALDAGIQARLYEAAGADAVSVLTEPDSFGGSLDDLRAAAASVAIPVLRKDFLVDEYQVWEAAEAGAAAALLIAAALPGDDLRVLLEECHACGLDALVEVHDEPELRAALDAGADLIGINNRNLRTLTVDLRVTEKLAPLVPAGLTVVSESGVGGAADAHRVRRAGARALLVGELLVTGLRCHYVNTISSLRATGVEP